MEFFKKNIFNVFNIKITVLILALLLEIPILMPYFNPMLKFTALWSLIYIIYDLTHERKLLDISGWQLILIFLISYFITVITNRNSHFSMNVISYSYIVVNLTIMLIPSSQPKRELSKINMMIVKVTMYASLIGILLFIVQFNGTISYMAKEYYIGFRANRLVGIYRGITTPTLAIAIMAGVSEILLRKGREKIPNVIYLSLLVNAVHLGLSNSKGVIYSLLVFIFITSFSGLYATVKRENKLTGKNLIVVVVVPILITLGFKQTLVLTNNYMSYVPSKIAHIYDISDEQNPEINMPIDLDREVPDHYDSLTGRPYLWKTGLEEFTKKPIFGHGAFSHAGDIMLPYSKQTFSTYHSFYVHTLFSSGIVGSIPLFGFIILCAIKAIKYVFLLNTGKDRLIIAAIVGVLGFFAVNAIAETSILFMNRFAEFFFWAYLGYFLSFTKIDYERVDSND